MSEDTNAASSIGTHPPRPPAGPHDRYSRQAILADFGPDSVERLAAAHAVVLGVGALGSGSAELLARAGVGAITLIDRDTVEWTNLQRQTLFTEADARDGAPKAEAAAAALARVNSSITIRGVVADVTPDNVERFTGLGPGRDSEIHAIGPPTVLIDGTDNFETRFLLNDLAVKHGVPYVYGAAIGSRGMLMTVLPAGHQDAAWADLAGPCLRCVLGEAPAAGTSETCDTAGVLGPVTAAVAAFQSVEALKIMLGRFDKLRRHLLAFDPWNAVFHRLDAAAGAQSSECECCGERRFAYLDNADASAAVTLCGSGDDGAIQLRGAGAIDLRELAQRLGAAGVGPLQATGVMVRANLPAAATTRDAPQGAGKAARQTADAAPKRDAVTVTVFADGRAIFRGVNDEARARSLYNRYVGG